MQINFHTILEDRKQRYIKKKFEKKIKLKRKPGSFEKAITGKKAESVNPIIAEIKPSSPTADFNLELDVKAVAGEIISAGACGISVLTEEKYFNGSLKNLEDAASISKAKVPVLRKDFIFDETQIAESYYYGADSLLLIASFFDAEKLKKFIENSRSFGMEPLVEIHSVEDIKKAEAAGATIYVVNNRDKDTLKIDLKRTERFSKHINGIKISASGITLKDLKFVLKYCDAALIGSEIMRSKDIGAKVREFVYA